MKAADIMSKRVIIIRAVATVADAVKLMRDHSLTCLIVERWDESDSYGIVSETDIIYKVAAKGLDPEQVRVGEIMTKPCIVVNPDLNIQAVAQLFAQTGIRHAPIIKDQLLGVISLKDLLLRSNFIEQPQSVLLQQKIQSKIADAHKIVAEQGITSEKSARAWDLVEGLEIEQAHQQQKKLGQTAFEEYCEKYPEAKNEAKNIEKYDPWVYRWKEDEN